MQFAMNCQYGVILDDALTQCFVCGLHNSVIQRRLLLEAVLTVEKDTELAKITEKAESTR